MDPNPLIVQHGANIPPVKNCPDRFKGQVIVITGAAQGIGAATASSFAAQGGTLVLVDINEDKLNSSAATFLAEGASVSCRASDLCKEEAVTELIDDIFRSNGKIDVLVHLAGIYPFNELVDMAAADYLQVMRVNMDSTFWLVRAVLPHMNRAGYGRIITTASSTTLHPPPGLSAYVASKSAVVGFTRSVAVEAGAGVTANIVSPGLIHTESSSRNAGTRTKFEGAMAMQCVKRCGLPKDVAEVICFIASPETEFVTGQVFDVSGGLAFT